MKSLPLAALLLASALPACGDGVDVSYRRAEGEVRSYVRTLDVEGGNPSGVKGRVRQEVATKETAVDVQRGRQATVEVEIRRIAMEVFRGDGAEPVLRMDSSVAPDAKAAAKTPETEAEKFEWAVSPMRFAAGGVVDMEQQFTGKIVQFGGVEDLQKRIRDALPEGDRRREVVDQFPWKFWLANLLAPAIGLPEGGMTPGADMKSWDMRTLPETTGTRGFMYYAQTYRLAKVEAGLARVEMEAEVSLDPPKGMPPWPKDVAARRAFLRLKSGACRAWAMVRVETGVLEEEEHVTDLDLHFVKPDGSGEIPIPTKVTLRTKRVP